MDFSTILTVVGAIGGQIVHVVKKRVEGGKEDEMAAFKSQILNKPFNTLGASIAAVAAAFQLVSPEATELVVQFFTAFTAGLAANSVVNRPGK